MARTAAARQSTAAGKGGPAASPGTLPSQFVDAVSFLRKIFEERRHQAESRMERYGYADFTEDLGFRRSTLMHQILRGHRTLTERAAAQIAKRLDLPQTEQEYLALLAALRQARSSRRRDAVFARLLALREAMSPSELDRSQLDYLSHWLHPVVRELVPLVAGEDDPALSLARRIRPPVAVAEVRASISLLERIGYVRRDDRNRLMVVHDHLATAPRVKGFVVQSYHASMIGRALDALRAGNPQRQDFSAATLRLTESEFQRLRGLIREFQLKAIQDSSTEAREEESVYQLNIQLFPFTET